MPFNADNNDSNNNNNQNQDPNQQINLKGSGGAATSQSGRIANFSTGATPQQASGSGRFNNLNKYISQNQSAGQNIGARINKGFGEQTTAQNKNISDTNSQIAQGFSSARSNLGQGEGFNTQLQNIGQGLGSFKSMEDRADFDTAAGQASAFTQDPNFNQFQNIQSGQAIDNQQLNTQQAQALQSGQNLNAFTQDKMNKINSEQGRYDLMKNAIGRNRGNYSSGNARFDQLFFENAPNVVGGLANTFNQANLTSQNTLGNINKQGTDLGDILNKETDLMSRLNTQTKSNQDIFNEKLGSQGNIDYINELRNAKYNEYLNQLNNGNISEEVAGDLGLNPLNTYDPTKANQVTGFGSVASQKMSADQARNMTPEQRASVLPDSTLTDTPATFQERSLRTYNALNDKDTNKNYLTKGRSASSMQDITSQADYDAYKALQSMSGIDSGKLAGASNIDKAVGATLDQQGQSKLANTIKAQDELFKKDFAGRDLSNYEFVHKSPVSNRNWAEAAVESAINSTVNMPQNLANIVSGATQGSSQFLDAIGRSQVDAGNIMTQGMLSPAVDEYNYAQMQDQNNNLMKDSKLSFNDRSNKFNDLVGRLRGTSGSTGFASSSTNLDDYLNRGMDAVTTRDASGTNKNTTAARNRAAHAEAIAGSKSKFQQQLDKIVNTTGVKNQAQLKRLDESSDAAKTLAKSKRFSKFV
jgi:hypothetical protein